MWLVAILCSAGLVLPWSTASLSQDFAFSFLDLVTKADPEHNIALTLAASLRQAQPGDEIELSVEAERKCYVTILHVSGEGRAMILWPNQIAGWDNTVLPRKTVRVTGPGTGLRIQADGKHKVERFIAIATSEKDAILKPEDFQLAHEGRVLVFAGTAAELGRTVERRIEGLPASVHWGGALLDVPVGQPGGAEPPVHTGQRHPQTVPFAIRTRDGRYLSAHNGTFAFVTTGIGPTEVFRLHSAGNDQYKIVAESGSVAVARPTAPGEELDRGQVFDILSHQKYGVGFRASNGRYMAPEEGGSRVVFNMCHPSAQTHRGFFRLIPVKGPGSLADERGERPSWAPLDDRR